MVLKYQDKTNFNHPTGVPPKSNAQIDHFQTNPQYEVNQSGDIRSWTF